MENGVSFRKDNFELAYPNYFETTTNISKTNEPTQEILGLINPFLQSRIAVFEDDSTLSSENLFWSMEKALHGSLDKYERLSMYITTEKYPKRILHFAFMGGEKRFRFGIFAVIESADKVYEIGDFSKLEEYVNKCPDLEVQEAVRNFIENKYEGDYSRLINYEGTAAPIEGWGAGGATQWEFKLSIDQLQKLGLVKEVSATPNIIPPNPATFLSHSEE